MSQKKGAGKANGKSAGKGRRKPPPTRRSGTPGRPPAKQARGRTGAIDGRPKKRSKEGLGGDQVEGVHAVREALLAGRRRIHEILLSTDRAEAPDLEDIRLLAEQYSVPVRELGRAKMSTEARTTAHQGVIAHASALRETDLEELFEPVGNRAPFLLACDGITDPQNLGALLRTAECAGVTGVLLPRHRAVHVTPAVTKAAAGAIEHLRFAIVGGIPTALTDATERGALVIGLDMGGDVSIHDLPPVDRAVVLVLGAEGRGVGRLARERCEVVASIPMTGAVESLNVSVAGALAIYEVVRRRG